MKKTVTMFKPDKQIGPVPRRLTEDEVFLREARHLVSMARNAIEEATSYASSIRSRKLKKEAQQLVDEFWQGM